MMPEVAYVRSHSGRGLSGRIISSGLMRSRAIAATRVLLMRLL
jgi:hypothetical protein